MNWQDQILKEYKSDEEIRKAILNSDPMIFSCMAQIIMTRNFSYLTLTTGNHEREKTDRVLADCLIAFRRQLKTGKISLRVNKGRIIVGTQNEVLADHLTRLFSLMTMIGDMNPAYAKSLEFEQSLLKGNGFVALYAFRDELMHSLHKFGCTAQEEKEDIFHETLLVFWNKLVSSEVGIYFDSVKSKTGDCQVYNRKFYQNSKLTTYLTGIARNLFLNRTKAAGFNRTTGENEIPVAEETTGTFHEPDNPVLLLFLYYRAFVEDRKLRSVVSMLQHDCSLEDKEVCKVIGINNARIHSCRLKAHFYEWYEQNKHSVQQIIDRAGDYYFGRESKKNRLNEKIRVLDSLSRLSYNPIDFRIFEEEFRNEDEFGRYSKIFILLFYFFSTGKTSALAGLPDEKKMRSLMAIYKTRLLEMPGNRAISLLLFYGTDEPESVITDTLRAFYSELKEIGVSGEIPGIQFEILKEEIYRSNQVLFSMLSTENSFIN
jgi:hypothetical protein